MLSWYEGFLKEDFSLAFVPHWFFGDWASNFEAGEPFREKDGNSAFQDLLFVMGLEAAANMEEAFGIPSYGKRYRETASSIKRTIKEKYWDAERGLFSDTRDRRNYSQHVNVLAILNEAVEGDEAPAFLNFSILVSAPKAVMAIVSRKVSSEWMNDTVASPNRPNELKPITARNPSANHGTAIRRVTPPQDRLSASRRRRALATEIE